MSSVAVIDYGMGNLHSISKALQYAEPDVNVLLTADADTILAADRVVFPGVGGIRDCIQALEKQQLTEVINDAVKNKPFLGICLGMQALLSSSEENEGIDCLNIIPGQVRCFSKDMIDSQGYKLKIPHMGWNEVTQEHSNHPLWQNIPQHSRFYFVHSYYVEPDDAQFSVATTCYPEPFSCVLKHNNIFAVQFHPEKSQTMGIQLLQNFLHWDGTN
ncbi:MAG TPA: imidazole glycerol phosphate synthase subunit HisH [Methylococcaceae bacterium]|jgi:glutamine amidotransferase|nr:imidazole glycerol phosphate synthase subunit HisH [Methylococcaceae bacterium]HIA45906.1 imidazole glycerol phosphate synthase subunit HisH [Methylococcaceae bacterium]HIN68179.1 imidazole glycerol phosphate synthase subunit HisH [Methylococcales bacterium]HIO12527.1 imidazole glycerol phosphate synthase subunit HisH [Methylococcales bacterium]HIO45369.1 imidazole glycerol phosphate synthase subunit HisH [Methylococcales bacterium]